MLAGVRPATEVYIKLDLHQFEVFFWMGVETPVARDQERDHAAEAADFFLGKDCGE